MWRKAGESRVQPLARKSLPDGAMVVSEIMSPRPTCVSVEESLLDAMEILDSLLVRHVPVVQEHRLVGMLSDRDLSSYRPDADSGAPLPGVAQAMSSDVVCVDPETDVADLIDMLLEHKIGAVPVIDPDTREVIGIVSYVDVLRSHADLFN